MCTKTAIQATKLRTTYMTLRKEGNCIQNRANYHGRETARIYIVLVHEFNKPSCVRTALEYTHHDSMIKGSKGNCIHAKYKTES